MDCNVNNTGYRWICQTCKKNENKVRLYEDELEITGKFKDALTRQANESLRIYKRKNTEILNSESEVNHPPTVRVMVEKKNRCDNKAK